VPRTLGEMLLAASARYGDDVAFQIRRGLRSERISYARAAEVARSVAAWCATRELRPGDRIATWAPNMPEYALLYFGAWLAGQLFDQTGSYTVALWVALGNAVVAPILMWIVAPRHPHPPPASANHQGAKKA